MKKLVLLVMLGSLLSCRQECCLRPIKASIAEEKVINDQDVYTIKTKNSYWFIEDIEFNGEGRRELLNNVNSRDMPYLITAPEFSIRVADEKTLRVTMDKNTTRKENTLILWLVARECSEWIKIVQPPRK